MFRHYPGYAASSQAWMFATPEEVRGKRVIDESKIWGSSTSPAKAQALEQELFSKGWGTSTFSKSEGDAGPPSSALPRKKGQGKQRAKTPKTAHPLPPQKVSGKLPMGDITAGNPGNLGQLQSAPSDKKKRKPNRKTKSNAQIVAQVATEGMPTTDNGAEEKSIVVQKTTNASTPVATKQGAKKRQKRRQKRENGVSEKKVPDTTGEKLVLKGAEAKHADNEPMEPLMDLVQRTVDEYRKQSAIHFALHIDVGPADTDNKPIVGEQRFKLNMTFQNYSQQVRRICQPALRKGRPTRKVLTRENGRLIPLHALLSKHFPVSEANTSDETLRAYWNANGKSFEWASLPTELKEHVIQFCIVKASRYRDNFHGIAPRSTRGVNMRGCELTVRLGEWRSLLYVSTQVRAIALRLCFTGSLVFEKGFCITSNFLSDFYHRLGRLRRYPQITEPDSVAKDGELSGMLRNLYFDSPKLYPELQRYASFFHGIRKIDIAFDFVDSYQFFNVTTGGFDKDRSGDTITCNVLDKLPHLNEIVIRLPKNRKRDWKNKPYQGGRPLFHDIFPCLRAIFRILYERIAEALAAYKNVSVKNFLDEIEERRFWDLRRAAMKTLRNADFQPPKLTTEELEELYAHDGGGLQLSEEELSQASQEANEAASDGESEANPAPSFYPIHCDCVVSCSEQYEFYP